MKITSSLGIAALSCLAASNISSGATITWSAAADNGFVLNDGVTLAPVGDMVRLGVFAPGFTDAMISTDLASGDFTAVNNAFTVLATTTFGHGVASHAGYFSANSTTPAPIDSSAGDLNVAGQQIYIWATSATSVAAVNSSTQNAIVYMPTSANGNWAVPSDAVTLGQTQIDVDALTGASMNPSTLLPQAKIVYGLFNSNPVAGSLRGQANFEMQAATAPEPAVSAMAVIGGLGLLLRRRRSVKA